MHNIGHFITIYLPRTMTFVYTYITNFVTVKSFVFAYETQNLDQFEVNNITKIRKYSLSWLWYQIQHKLSGDGPGFERHLFDLNNMRSVRSRLIDNDIRLIHSHIGPMGCYNLNLKKNLGLPMVTTFYGIDLSFFARAGWVKRYAPLFDAGECFFVEGSHMKTCLAELGCPHDKIKIIHIGADTTEFAYKPRTIGEGRKIILLFCGRLIEKKGLEYALRALALVRNRYANIEFRIIGDGPLQSDIVKLIQDLNLDDVVKLLGYVPYAETKREMNKAHILVQPSVTAANGETEGGAPTVLIEAQACGMPILASLHADIPEVVLDGDSGLLSEERNFKQLAEHMAFLFDHPEKWPEMGRVGRRHVEENYNIKVEAKKIERIYTDLIG